MKRLFLIVLIFVSSLSYLFCELEEATDVARKLEYKLDLFFEPEQIYSYEVGFSSSPVTQESESVGRIEGNAFSLNTLEDGAYVYGSLTEGAYLYWKIISSQNVTIYVALEDALSYDNSSNAETIDWALSWDGDHPSSTNANNGYTYGFDNNRYVHKHTGDSLPRDIDSVKLTMETEHISADNIGNYYAQRYAANIMVKVEAE